jgi:ectoine hydroxylase-related dioxygenase (phytanoyl-CoA dioxygenase family)
MAHCDASLIVTCWIPLVDATVDNGCLHVIPRAHQRGVFRHYHGGPAGFLIIDDGDLPPGDPIPIEMKAGDVLFMTNTTPHASFANNTDVIRWSVDLRYQSPGVPNSVDEDPSTYSEDRDPVTMACYPPEADFVIRDHEHPEREVKTAEQFHELRARFWKDRPVFPGRGWTAYAERT